MAGLSLAVASASLPLLALGWLAAGLAMAALVGHTGTPVALAASRAAMATDQPDRYLVNMAKVAKRYQNMVYNYVKNKKYVVSTAF